MITLLLSISILMCGGGGDKKGKGEKIYIHDTHTEQRLLLLLF